MTQTPVIRIDDATLTRLHRQATVAHEALLVAMRARYVPGAPIAWMHSEGRQVGEVLAWSDDTVHVRNETTQAEYPVGVAAIVGAL